MADRDDRADHVPLMQHELHALRCKFEPAPAVVGAEGWLINNQTTAMTNSEHLQEDERKSQEEQAVQRLRHLIEEGLASGPVEARPTDDLSELRGLVFAVRE